MFCSNCGKNLPNNAMFCDGCGTKQEVNLPPLEQMQIESDNNTPVLNPHLVGFHKQ